MRHHSFLSKLFDAFVIFFLGVSVGIFIAAEYLLDKPEPTVLHSSHE